MLYEFCRLLGAPPSRLNLTPEDEVFLVEAMSRRAQIEGEAWGSVTGSR